jgi:hypothetical protein
LWPSIKTNPRYAPELLTSYAAARLAPHVREHAAWLRDTYPDATPDALARLATVERVRQVRVRGAMAGLLGSLAVLADSAALAWTQTRLVLDIATAYGHDPADPERVAEVLTLRRVHRDLDHARAALAAAADDGRTADRRTYDEATGDGAGRLAVPVVRLGGRVLARLVIGRRAARVVPGASAVLTAVTAARSTERLAARAVRFYRP